MTLQWPQQWSMLSLSGSSTDRDWKRLGSESWPCPGLQPGLHSGVGRQKDVSQADIHLEQLLAPPAQLCGGPRHLLQH